MEDAVLFLPNSTSSDLERPDVVILGAGVEESGILLVGKNDLEEDFFTSGEAAVEDIGEVPSDALFDEDEGSDIPLIMSRWFSGGKEADLTPSRLSEPLSRSFLLAPFLPRLDDFDLLFTR